jgi:tetratricopeptide (TPR) repeat protein
MAAAPSERRGSDGPPAPKKRGWTLPLLAVAAISSTIGFAICIKVWMATTGATNDDILRTANRQYSSDNLIVAGELAKRVEVVAEEPEKAMLKHFLIGAGKMREGALTTDARVSRAAFHIAAEQFLIASQAWPAGREDEGDRMLGEALFQTGHFAEAIPRLESVIGRNPTYREPLTPILARCLMRSTDTDLQRALTTIRQYKLLPGRPLGSETDAAFMEAECLIRLGQFQAARELLTVYSQTSHPGADDEKLQQWKDETDLLSASATVSEAIARYGPGALTNPKIRPEVSMFLQPTMETLLRLQRDASPKLSQRTGIWIARAARCMGDPGEALSQLNAVRLYQPFEGEGIAAALEQIEILVGQGNGNEAVQTARYMIREVGGESNYDSSIVGLPTFRLRLQMALAVLRDRGETDACVRLARTLPPLFPLDQALYEEGLAFREAGDRMEATLGQRFDLRDQSQQSKLRSLYAQAGTAFESSSRLRYESDDYTKTIWDAISALQKSGQFERSIPLLNDYLNFEQRIQHPRALIALGQAHLANSQPEEAIRPLKECMEEFPRDPLCYDARLQVAKALAELDQIDEARRLLEINLNDGELTPQSLTWKESLLSLGEILWRQSNETHTQESLKARGRRETVPLETLRANQPLVEESISRLREAVIRYWPDPRALQAATYLASANRLAAVLPDEEARIPDALDATRRRLLKKREEYLYDAIDNYRKIRGEISRIEDERELGPSEQSMRQIGLLGEADTLFELQQYEQSADAYRTISLRYMNEPPALEAMLGQARCLRSMKRERDARLVIRQAVTVLSRIPAEWDNRFAETTRYDRQGWESLLTWMDREPLPPATDS